jgi:acylphosphatase
MAGETNQRLHAQVDGHVQGVGFRFFVRENADQLNLCGWVRNTWDGKVELVVEGPRPALEEMLDQVRRGPRGCFVTRVDYEWESATGQYRSFSIAPTM